jgi:hypothetical protein
MKISFLLLTLSISFSSFGAIVTSKDVTNNCTAYRIVTTESPAQSHESLQDQREFFGFSLGNMEIDFANKVVYVDVIKRILFGFNRNVVEGRVVIRPENPNFNALVNQLNRVVLTLSEVCITEQNELMWATPLVQK